MGHWGGTRGRPPSLTPPRSLQDALDKESSSSTVRSSQRVLDGKVVTETKEVKVRVL